MNGEGDAMRHPLPSIETKVTAQLALDAADWDIATWRPRTPRPRPVVPSFDRASCLARLRRIAAMQATYTAPDWTRASIADLLSREEAHFWFLAMTDPSRELRQGSLLRDLDRLPLTGDI